ncbi:MAG: methyltransferase [Paracoccaceae bacterium]
MTHPRLSLALAGADALPHAGRILVFGPRGVADLTELPKDRSLLVQGFRPAHDAFDRQGWQVVPSFEATEGGYAAGIVFLPRARAAARAAVAEIAARVAPGGGIWVDGQKTDGVDTMVRDIRSRVPISLPIAKAHGKIFRFDAPGDGVFHDWRAVGITPAPGFVSVPGVFSAEKPDHGSRLLAEAIPPVLGGRVADLGAGWGWLSAQLSTRQEITELHLIEADAAALGCARRNIADQRAQFHWADVTNFRPEAPFDAVVMNPPFHTGRAAEPELGAAFIMAAAKMLTPQGTLYMVANRHLPYEAVLKRHFRETAEIGGDSGFKVLRATRPAAARPHR